MAGLFEDLKVKQPKLPDNIQVNTGLFNDLMPNDKKQKFKLSTEGNPGENIDFSDIEKPGLFDDLKPETQKEDIDGDQDLWQKVKFAAGIGFFDTYRGVKHVKFAIEMGLERKRIPHFLKKQVFSNTQDNLAHLDANRRLDATQNQCKTSI